MEELSNLEDAILGVDDLSLDKSIDEPTMTSPEWSEFVMRQFTENELDAEGRPLVHGLRRVVRLLLGPILESRARVVQAPSLIPSIEKVGILQPAVVEHTVRILMTRLEQGLSEAYPVEFCEAADCYFGNVGDIEFARYQTAMASTRAESRALRKALQINTIASEEKSVLPSCEAGLTGMISPEQVNFLTVLCSRLDINVMKYINSGKTKYDAVEKIPYGVAALMVEHLSKYQNNPSTIPSEFKGYVKGWRNNN
jgi:hypothetical protein